MKTIISSLSILAASVFIIACSSKKDATVAPAATTSQKQVANPASPEVKPATPPTQATEKTSTMRFVVSFYSTGGGIDSKTKDEFVNFINSYPTKIAYEPKSWGREGEVDFCLGLTELNAQEQVSFISKANTILSKSKLVHKKENGACDQTNWESNNTVPEADVYRLVVSYFSEGGGVDLNNKV